MKCIIILFALLMMGASACPTEPVEEKDRYLKRPPDFPGVPPADSSGYFQVIENIGAPPEFPIVPPPDSGWAPPEFIVSLPDSSWYDWEKEYYWAGWEIPVMNDTISETDEFNEEIINEEGADSTEYSMGVGNKLGIVVAVAVNGLAILAWILSLR